MHLVSSSKKNHLNILYFNLQLDPMIDSKSTINNMQVGILSYNNGNTNLLSWGKKSFIKIMRSWNDIETGFMIAYS